MAKNPTPPGHILSEKFADPDLVDRIFDYVVNLLPELAPRQAEIKHAVREEFAGERAYVRRRGTDEKHDLAVEVLRLFNGRNAHEVGRQLQISRSHVYRLRKQLGAGKQR